MVECGAHHHYNNCCVVFPPTIVQNFTLPFPSGPRERHAGGHEERSRPCSGVERLLRFRAQRGVPPVERLRCEYNIFLLTVGLTPILVMVLPTVRTAVTRLYIVYDLEFVLAHALMACNAPCALIRLLLTHRSTLTPSCPWESPSSTSSEHFAAATNFNPVRF